MSTNLEAAQTPESPYAPPKALVADVESTRAPMERPANVTRAVKCLWTVLGIGIVSAILNFITPAAAQFPLPIMIGMYVVIFLISAWMYSAIARGRNWARILFLIFSGLSILSIPMLVFSVISGAQNVFTGLVGLLNLGISFYACYLLLTAPAREWFRSMKSKG